MKATKILRRGRRIKQVEAMYGKQNSQSPTESRGPSPFATTSGFSMEATIIPELKPQFFDSPFWKSFHIQRPILDPLEFSARYQEYYTSRTSRINGAEDSFPQAAHLIASLLVIWADTFGLDECGNPYHPQSHINPRARSNDMIKEALDRVDSLGLLRKPSWDGLRALLLLLPLTHDVLSGIDRQVMHESTMSQVFTLCSLGASQGQLGLSVDPIVRARIFWYAYSREGVTSGPKGSRMFLSGEDLGLFQSTIPVPKGDLEYYPGNVSSSSSSQYDLAYQLASVPLRISQACRQAHSFFKQRRGAGKNDEQVLKAALGTLEMSWYELDQFHQFDTKGLMSTEERSRYVITWKIIVFECFFTISENLARYEDDSCNNAIQYLQTVTNRKCRELIPHLGTLLQPIVASNTPSEFFTYDTGLAQRGVVCAAILLTRLSDAEFESRKEVFNICLEAIRQMRWAYADSAKVLETLVPAFSQPQQQQSRAQYLLTPPITPILTSTMRITPPLATAPANLVLQDTGYAQSSSGYGSYPSTPISPSWDSSAHNTARGSPPHLALYVPQQQPYDPLISSPTSPSMNNSYGYGWPKFEPLE